MSLFMLQFVNTLWTNNFSVSKTYSGVSLGSINCCIFAFFSKHYTYCSIVYLYQYICCCFYVHYKIIVYIIEVKQSFSTFY